MPLLLKQAAGLTEAQLKMVEEIAGRYIAAQPSPRKRRRWPWVLAAAALCLVLFHLFDRLDRMNGQYVNLQNSLYRVESSVYGQIGSLSNRVEEILKAQNSLVADCGVELEAVDLAANTVTFSAYAVPKTYVEGMAVEFLAENGETAQRPAGQCGRRGPQPTVLRHTLRPLDGPYHPLGAAGPAGRHPPDPAAGPV